MKILDRYVARNFLFGYFIAFMVLMGMRIVIDLFVNLDEFAEHSELGAAAVLFNIIRYYGYQSALYFRDFAGMITVVAAVFSLGKMTRNNELIAVMASGVSLKRVIAPILLISLILMGLLVADQELIIPNMANQLVRAHDELPGEQRYEITFMEDNNYSLVSTLNYYEKDQTMHRPTIILRRQVGPSQWEVTGQIKAEAAVYNPEKRGWDLVGGQLIRVDRVRQGEDEFITTKPKPVNFYATDITPQDIPQRRKEAYKELLSSGQLSYMARQGKRIKDLAELYSQKHFRITDPIINLVMLLIALPVLVCREPKAMKTAISISFATTTACFITTFVCKMMATEVLFNQVRPEIWAWTPVFIFLPIAFIEFDSMRT